MGSNVISNKQTLQKLATQYGGQFFECHRETYSAWKTIDDPTTYLTIENFGSRIDVGLYSLQGVSQRNANQETPQ